MEVTKTSQQTVESLNGKLVFEQDNNRIVGRDNTNKVRLLISADGNNFVMKIAKDGFDATTAQDDELVLNSDRNAFKIHDTGEVTVAVGETAGTVYSTEVAHTLGYRPIVIAQARYSIGGTDETQPFPFTFSQYFSGDIQIRLEGKTVITDTAVQFIIFHDGFLAGAPTNFTVKYYILTESGVS